MFFCAISRKANRENFLRDLPVIFLRAARYGKHLDVPIHAELLCALEDDRYVGNT
jgi:hypothetical protein